MLGICTEYLSLAFKLLSLYRYFVRNGLCDATSRRLASTILHCLLKDTHVSLCERKRPRVELATSVDTLVRGEPLNEIWPQETRNIALSYDVDILIDDYLLLSQFTRLTDGQTDRWTDRRTDVDSKARCNRVRCALKTARTGSYNQLLDSLQ